MRKLILCLLALLLIPMALSARELNGSFTSGTSTRGIDLQSDIFWTMITPLSADVTVTVYNTVSGTATVIETITVRKGDPKIFYTGGMDSVRVARATATAVDWALSPVVGSTPSMAYLGANIDSLVALLSAPAPVDVVTGQTLLTADVVRHDISMSGPVTGLYVDGAVGLMVVCQYDSFRTRNAGHDKMTIYNNFVYQAGDTTTTCITCSSDTIVVDAATLGTDTGSFVYYPTLPAGQEVFTGYFYITLDSWGVATLRDFRSSATVVWK